ncbi:hypothetical protein BH23ACT11_BH23ACT11_18080 [soil metagenome]
MTANGNRRKGVEELAEVTQESYRAVIDRTFAARESNARVARNFFEDTVEELHEQRELHLRTTEELAGHMHRQREDLLKFSRESLDSYEGFVGSLSDYYEDFTDEENQ